MAVTVRKKILIVEDDGPTRRLLSLLCQQNGYIPVECGSARSVRESTDFSWGELEAMVLDLGLPDADGFDLLREVLGKDPELPCFVLTMRDSARAAVECLKAGAVDYFTKPFDPAQLFQAIRNASASAAEDSGQMHLPYSPSGDFQWPSAVGKRSHEDAVKASRSSAPVLVIGEVGTGKASVARMIHGIQKKPEGLFRVVNAAAYDSDALRAEIFGIDSDATARTRRGQVELAAGGTLYIDAVESLSLAIQVELNEMLETDRFKRFGAECFIAARCQVICATTIDLEKEVEAGRFRHDLLLRLKSSIVYLAPLKARIEDMPVFCELFLSKILVRDKRPRLKMSEAAKALLLKYSWPGNLDELNHALEHACRHCGGGDILPKHLPHYARKRSRGRNAMHEPVLGSSSIGDVERASLIAALTLCKGNRRLVAERLGVSLRTIYNMIERHQLRGWLRS